MRAWITSKGVRRTEPEYELRDAFGKSGCAVCRLALRTAARQLDILSYENVNDLDLRARLRESRGFCNRHAWQLLEQTRDPLGAALIYKDVINTLIPHLRLDNVFDQLAARLRRLASTGLASRLASRRECPVCVAERETEEVYLSLLGTRIAETSFGDAWAGSDGLCWPHLLAALPRARSDEALSLLAQQPASRWAGQSIPGPGPTAGEPQPSGGATAPPGEPASPSRDQPSEAPPAAETVASSSAPEEAASADAPAAGDHGESDSESDPFPLPESPPRPRGADGTLGSRLPLGSSLGEADVDRDVAATLRALALSHGRWSADQSLLPRDLVVDLQQRKLEAVTRPAGEKRPQCHSCHESAEAMERRLAGVLAEGIVAEDLGTTCERHAWQLARRRPGALTVPLALLLATRRQALAAAVQRARAERSTVGSLSQAGAGSTGERAAALLRAPDGAAAICHFCEQEARIDREVSEGAVGMRRPVALCRIHVSVAAGLSGPRPRWQALLSHQAARWQLLSAALADFIRKHDYRFAQETRGEERDSPWRAVEEIAGRKGMA